MEATHYDWRTNFILMVSVIVTVVAALLLAQMDELQSQESETATAVVIARVTVTPRETVQPFTPEANASPLPSTPTPTLISSEETTAIPVPMQATCEAIPASWLPYEVVLGDSLMSLAAMTQGKVAELMQANCLLTSQLEPGMTIYLPAGPPPTSLPCGPPRWWVLYIVQRGDTMFSLSVKTGTTVAAIKNANCLSNSNLVAGRQIYLPMLPSPPTSTALPLTATPTLVPTDTPMPTQTPTTVVTTTVTATASATVSATATATSITPTETATATAVPATNTPLPTNTATVVPPTATDVPTATPTVSITATPTATATAVPPTTTATSTVTPTSTTSPSPTVTTPPTATPTLTATATATVPVTPTATSTTTETATATPTATPIP